MGRMTASIPAQRIRAEREARGWSQRDAVRRLRMLSPGSLPSDDSLVRSWKKWEAGDHLPDGFYRPLIAELFGTVTAAMFPEPPAPAPGSLLLTATGMSTTEIIARVRGSSIDTATLEGLRITADQLCCEYPYMPSEQLATEGRQWLRRITALLEQSLTLTQHREVLSLAGLVALLVGCVENDMGNRRAAEATRRSALALGTEADDRRVVGWAHEMSAWFSLTDADYPGVIAAAEAGIAAAGDRDVSVQLLAQRAKAFARVGDRRGLEIALDTGRQLLERQSYPDDLSHQFVFDPAKWDFYAMDCYRHSGQDDLARTYADEVLRVGTSADGQVRTPMRNAEAHVTLAIVAAREGDLASAVSHGEQALLGERKSLPTLLMVSQELAAVIRNRWPSHPDTEEYIGHLRHVAQAH
jgi:transcriptional regulator with XRE-family HTH domain